MLRKRKAIEYFDKYSIISFALNIMGDAECSMETNIKEDEILNANSPSRSDNEHFPMPRQEQTEAVMWSPENSLHDGRFEGL